MRIDKLIIAVAVCAALAIAPAFAGCAGSSGDSGSSDASSDAPKSEYTTFVEDFHNTDIGLGWEPTETIQLDYATCFSMDYFEGGYKLACLYDGGRYLIVPEGAEVPEGLAEDVQIIQQPLHDLYLVASDTGCLFDALDALDTVAVSGIKQEDWAITALSEAMENGSIAYGGKYNAPDYDLLLQHEVPLAIESTMINHTPEVADKLKELGVVVLTEMSSYEDEPLGRSEWIKFFGALLDKEDLAKQLFDEQKAQVEAVAGADTGKTVAFFYINSGGSAVVRKPGDYVTSMLKTAGGTYVFDELGDEGGTSTVTMEMEKFYTTAKDADIIIYNATIDGGVPNIDALVSKNELLANFKAVQEGNVWCTEQNMYQQMLQVGTIISDFNKVFTGGDGELTYLYKLD